MDGLLAHLGMDARTELTEDAEGNLHIEVTGERMGMLIGRRGDMLDAVQHLTGYAANRGEARFVRVTVDTERYRQKREEALVQLAEKTADRVIKYRRSVSLEPMNSYARHIIHTALQENPEVTTFSTGVEPNRRVVIALQRADGRPASVGVPRAPGGRAPQPRGPLPPKA